MYLGLSELRVITKMTEDLRYTKAELEVADSIITHQQEVIGIKEDIIDLRTRELQENIKKSTKDKTKIGVGSGIFGLFLGVILGILL